MTVPSVLGTSHAKIVWVDKNGNAGAEQLTTAQFNAIGAGIPPKPASFVGTAQQWKETWCHRDNDCAGPENGARAYIGSGRKDVSTPSSEYQLGSIQVLGNGNRRIYLGDPDIDGFLVIQPSDVLSGTGSNISTKSKCGLSASAGQISGTLDPSCDREK